MIHISSPAQEAFPSAEGAVELSGVGPELAIAILIVSIVGYALVNSVEISLVASNQLKMRRMAKEGSKAAKAVRRLRAHQERFFAGIVLLQNLFVVLASSMGSIIAADAVGGVGGLAVGVAVLTIGIALLGEVTPKVLATHAGERYALLIARPTELVIWALRPLVAMMAATPSLLSHLMFGERANRTEDVTEMELRTLIDMGAEAGTVEKSEAVLLDRVFRFGDRRVNEVMVPRPEMKCLGREERISDFYNLYAQHPHSRFPVYDGSVDNVVGIVGIKDVLRGLSKEELSEQSPIHMTMRPAMFAPETKPVGLLFGDMQRAGHQMAIVADEFGGTAGIVTIEMLLEEIVGLVSDELRRHEKEFEPVDERTIVIDAGMAIHDANDTLGLEFPEGEYETVAGFVLSRLGHIPNAGEMLTYDKLLIAVTQMAGQKIERVTVTRI